MNEKNSPCAADALFGTKTIAVDGKTVGIARLCDAIADVRGLCLARDDELRPALISRVRQDNYIPEKLSEQYADALLSEYHAAERKDREGSKRS